MADINDDKKKNEVIKSLRSLLNSTKTGLLEKQLRRDYREFEGIEIPYKSFGYSSLLDFLRATNEFDFVTTNDGIVVLAKLTETSQHVVDLVGTQNRVKKKKNAKSVPFIPRLRPDSFGSSNSRKVYSKPAWVARKTPNMQQQQRTQLFANSTNRCNSGQISNRNQSAQNNATKRDKNSNYEWNQPHWNSQAQAQMNYFNWSQTQLQHHQLQQQQYQQPTTNTYEVTSWNHTSQTNPQISMRQLQNACNMAIQRGSSNDKWQHDLYESNTSAILNTLANLQTHLKPLNANISKPNVNHSAGILSSCLTDKANPVKQTVFDRLGPKIKSTVPLKKSMVQHRLNINTTITGKAPDTVDFASKQNNSMAVKKSSQIEAACKSHVDRLETGIDALEQKSQSSSQTKLNQNENSADNQTNVEVNDTKSKISNKMQQIDLNGSDVNMAKNDSKSLLNMYCEQHNFDRPMYSCKETRFKKFVGTVTVQGVQYTTEPIEHATESLAENAAAEIALSNLKEYPISCDTSEQIAQKIYNCINMNGIVLKHMPNVYEQKYEQSLPDGWMNIIQNRPEMFSIEYIANLLIVFAIQSNASHPIKETVPIKNTSNIKRTTDAVDLNETIELAALNLPWDRATWIIDLTMVISTVDVWGCISESDDFNNLHTALTQIESNLSNGIYPNTCQHVIEGGIYLAIHPNDDQPNQHIIYRVRVEAIDRNKQEALCFYIDDGFQEWLSFGTSDSKLYQLDRILFTIPAQAIHFCLFNLEDFADSLLATGVANKYLTEKSFLAKIKTTPKEFETQLDSNDSEARIRVILYDTTTDEDILMNKVILQEICDELKSPQLGSQKTNIVNVTHVSENGDIYCRIHGSKDMHIIKQIIHRLTNNGINDKYRVDCTEINSGKLNDLQLIYEKSKGRWYRAKILPEMFPLKQKRLCELVDYGHNKYIEYENIYNLERLSMALSKYPFQVIRVKLNGLNQNDYTPKVVTRLEELLCCNKPIYFEIVKQADVPLVNIWKRVNGLQCKINDSIRREIELENSPDLAPLPDSDSFSSSDDESNQKQTDLPPHPMPDLNQEIHEVTVVTALNPFKFYVRLNSTQFELNKMNNCLYKEYESSKQVLSKKDIKSNHIYAARTPDGVWQRVKVLKMFPNNDVEVKKCDYGDIDTISITALRQLQSSYYKIPQMVFCARLHNIQPRQIIWNKDDCKHFQGLTVGKLFKTIIKRIHNGASNGDQFIAEIILISSNNFNISEQFVREQRATYL